MPGLVRRHRSTLLIGLGPGRRGRDRHRARHRHPDRRPRWTRTTPVRTAPARWPGCSTTRASTCRWPAAPTRSRRSTWTATPRWSSCSPEYLGTSTIDRLRDHTGDAHTRGRGRRRARRRRRVRQLRRWRRRSRSATAASRGCDDPRFDGLTLEVDSTTALPGRRVLRRQGRRGRRPSRTDGLVLFGADQALTNDQILRGRQRRGGAAAARPGRAAGLVRPRARRPGRRRRREPPDPPAPVGPAGAGCCSRSSMVTVILWRARRLGALATEPLPVVVRAVETTRSLGRLYRRSGDRGHAAESLRRRALAPGSPSGCGSAPPPHADVLAREVARRTGRTEDDVVAVLGPAGAVPSSRPRPDHPGQGAGRARQRGTPHMTDRTQSPTVATTREPHASGWPRCAPRSARPWSGRTPRSPACSSRCCAAATC